MSSFICSPKHFNSVEDKLKRLAIKDDFYFPYALKQITPNCYNKRESFNEHKEEEIENLINVLRELNVLCVSLQYKHHYEGFLDKEIEEQRQVIKTRTEVKDLSMLGLYNGLRCIHYQIETEHLKDLRALTPEESNALTFLQQMIYTVAEEIIREMPDDDTNRWEVK